MKKHCFVNLIWVLVWLVLPYSLTAMEYPHTLDVKNMQFSWAIEDDKIHIRFSAKTTGWVGVGFDPEKAMSGANIIIGAVENGKLRIEDHYATRKTGHTSDENLGGTNDVLNPSGFEANGVTTLLFTLPLVSGDEYDKPIITRGMMRVMLAYGVEKDSFKTHHPYRTIYEINFSTGENKKIK